MSVSARKIYVSGERRGANCLGGTVEPCPRCGKNSVRMPVPNSDGFVFVHTVRVSFRGEVPKPEVVDACESRIHRPGLIAPPPGLALPREVHDAQRRG